MAATLIGEGATPGCNEVSLRIRLYELKTPDKFNNADFFSLYEQDNTVLP